MKKLQRFSLQSILTSVAMASLLFTTTAAKAEAPQAQGLWKYTGLTSSKGQDMPLTGIFLISDGKFLQQAVFNGEPYAEQESMAHTGSYTGTAKGIKLQAGQTLGMAPFTESSLSDAGATEHDLAVTREDDSLVLVFGSGTRQTFDRVSAADSAEIYSLENGMLAFVDDYFILVQGDAESAVTGYGTYRKDGDSLTLNVIRWSEAANDIAQNLRDVTLSARFDGKFLELADGRTFPVTH